MNLGIRIYELVLGNENEHPIAAHSNTEKSHNQNIGHKSQTPEKTHSMIPFIRNAKISQTNGWCYSSGEWLLWVGE